MIGKRVIAQGHRETFEGIVTLYVKPYWYVKRDGQAPPGGLSGGYYPEEYLTVIEETKKEGRMGWSDEILDPQWAILNGDAQFMLSVLPSESAHCVVTSPPYYALRDYGVEGQLGLESRPDCLGWATGDKCGECYICRMVAIFSEVKRVLRSDGVCWLNIGDSYAGSGRGESVHMQSTNKGSMVPHLGQRDGGAKPKDMLLVPQRLALALQADGWYVRSDVIWAKKAPMPESVQDRPSRSHEYIWMLTKSAKYFYDAEAVKVPSAYPGDSRLLRTDNTKAFANPDNGSRARTGQPTATTRNLRSVWHVGTSPFSEAHFATFPPEVPEKCIRAATSERGCCPACGSAWERIVERNLVPGPKAAKTFVIDGRDFAADKNDQGSNRAKHGHKSGYVSANVTLGWQPTCKCNAGDPVPCVVLDPFSGAGTTGLVARQLGRKYIGIELNPDYVAMSERRIVQSVGLTPSQSLNLITPMHVQMRMIP